MVPAGSGLGCGDRKKGPSLVASISEVRSSAMDDLVPHPSLRKELLASSDLSAPVWLAYRCTRGSGVCGPLSPPSSDYRPMSSITLFCLGWFLFQFTCNRLQLIQGNGGGSSSSPRTMVSVLSVLEIIALVMQVTRVDLKTLYDGHLLIVRCNAECAKLKECAHKLRALLLQRPAPTGLNLAMAKLISTETLVKAVGLDMATQLHRAMALAPEALVEGVGLDIAKQVLATADKTLVEAEGLVDSYSTFWCLVQTSTSMEAQLGVMQDKVNSLCMIVPCVDAYPLIVTVHPASDTTNATVISHPLHGAETSDSQRFNNGTGLGGTDDQSDNTEPEEYQSVV